MSVDYFHYLLIGVEVPVEKLTKEIRKEHRHQFNDILPTMKFCPECGNKVISADDRIYDGFYHEENHELIDRLHKDGLSAVSTTNGKRHFIGFTHRQDFSDPDVRGPFAVDDALYSGEDVIKILSAAQYKGILTSSVKMSLGVYAIRRISY